MRLPHAEFKIGDRAIHERTGVEGSIYGISRQGDTLVYLFDCPIFRQWVPSYKLLPLKGAEATIEEEVEYKTFKLYLNDLREVQMVVVGVALTPETLYEQVFIPADYEKARALYDFLRVQETLSESFLSMIGLEKVIG